MKYDLIIKEEANKEIIEAFLYYESKLEGLGDKFQIQLEIYLNYIEKNPYNFQIKRNPFREAFIKKFPYIVIYEIMEKEVIVYAVFCTKRNPNMKP